MIKGDFNKERERIIKILPVYLTVQVVMLVMTYLDFSVYAEVYRMQKFLVVTPWLGAWFLLAMAGLIPGIYLLVSKTGKRVFNEVEQARFSLGWLFGVIAGLLTLGIRFMPVMPGWYFYIVGGLFFLLSAIYWTWNKRHTRANEIFP
ncbi:MAG: hypothetical protein RBT34_12220 [Anaerolineaceae bacterium]|jgi:hypothetical protein|nr:hypothetical protein [Anaerolineaceae bacterium]